MASPLSGSATSVAAHGVLNSASVVMLATAVLRDSWSGCPPRSGSTYWTGCLATRSSSRSGSGSSYKGPTDQPTHPRMRTWQAQDPAHDDCWGCPCVRGDNPSPTLKERSDLDATGPHQRATTPTVRRRPGRRAHEVRRLVVSGLRDRRSAPRRLSPATKPRPPPPPRNDEP